MDNRVNNRGVIGNKGGRRGSTYTDEDRQEIKHIKQLLWRHIKKVMLSNDEKRKDQFSLKLGLIAFPKEDNYEEDISPPTIVQTVSDPEGSNEPAGTE